MMATEAQFNTVASSGSDARWRVAGAVAPTLILSASQDVRVRASIFNDSAASLYLIFGGGPVGGFSPTGSYDMKVPSGTVYEIPQPIYQGEIWGIWDAASGWAHIMSLGGPK